MIKIIAFYEDTWMSPFTSIALYEHVTKCYGGSVQMIRDWEDADIPPGYPIVVCDEKGQYDSLDPRAHPDNAVYVFGRSNMNILSTIPKYTFSIKVSTPYENTMFGSSAAAIILNHRLLLKNNLIK